MKKFFSTILFLSMALMILSLSGCGGSSKGKIHVSGNNNVEGSSYDIKQVAVISSPALEMNKYYRIYSGAQLSGMDNAQFYVANVGNESQQSTLNLGFSYEPNPDDSLVIVNDRTGKVVFAYNPSGAPNTWKTGSDIRFTDGRLLRYRSLVIGENASSENVEASVTSESFDVDPDDIIYLTFNGTSIKYPNEDYDPEYGEDYTREEREEDEDYEYYHSKYLDIATFDYVWHADPDHKDEYYTIGLTGKEEYEWEDLDKNNYENYGYIAHDARYIDSSLNFVETQTAEKDGEQEYVVYYSDEIASAIAAEKGEGFEGPYIFATLPKVRNSTLAKVKAAMTHTPKEAYDTPVFHIADDGIYSLKGTWNGQICVDDNVSAVLILNGLTVNCNVGPAIIIASNTEDSYYTDEEDVADMILNVDEEGEIIEPDRSPTDLALELIDDLLSYNENVIVISDDTTNKITGSNVYRILKAEPKSTATKVNGTNISAQKKLTKMDGAVYSFSSFAIVGGEKGNGKLNIKSTTLEGLGSEMHLVIEGGTINIEAPDDGINVNEDNVSVFTTIGGNVTIKSENGDGIDSNGYVIIGGGTLNITAGNQRTSSVGEAGIDTECSYYIYNEDAYTWTRSSNSPELSPNSPDISPDVSPDLPPIESPDIPDEPEISPDLPDKPEPHVDPVISPDTPPVKSPDVTPVISPDIPDNPEPHVDPVISPDTPPVKSPDVTPVISPDIPDTPEPHVDPVISPDTPPVKSPDVTPVVSPEETPETPVNTPDTNIDSGDKSSDEINGTSTIASVTSFNFNNYEAKDTLRNTLGLYADVVDLLANDIANSSPRTTVDKSEVPEDEIVKIICPIYRVSYAKIYVFSLNYSSLLEHFNVGDPIFVHSTAKTLYGTSFYSSAEDFEGAVIVDNNGNRLTKVPQSAANGINVATYMKANTNYSVILTTSGGNDSTSDNSDSNSKVPWTAPDIDFNFTNESDNDYGPSDANIVHSAKTTDRGTTTINIGSGSRVSFVVNDEDSDKPRQINSSGYILPIERKVNTFSAITVGTGD